MSFNAVYESYCLTSSQKSNKIFFINNIIFNFSKNEKYDILLMWYIIN